MNKQIRTRRLVDRAGVDVGRRNLLKLTGVGVAALGMISVGDTPALAQSTLAWDKTFPKSERVDHRKVSFYNRLGITPVADLYIPKTIDRSRRHAALVVGGPFGAVKEQASGLYAQTMTATLDDNVTSREFISLLPLTLTLEDYNSTEKISNLPNLVTCGRHSS